ncbi:hypothetical protein HNR26_000182 [Rhizobium rosettiformans]|uniref:Uncharacterized protein n=1 Tax=Rhizobium rosettiformans TaxID=1368430 RepID=A0A7W8HL70_9HYPH|nr:hypothetical protein [Rhizobium rosettiformans]
MELTEEAGGDHRRSPAYQPFASDFITFLPNW